MKFDDPENPKMLEDFIRAIGAEPVVYAQRNECCGGYMAVENKAYAASRRRDHGQRSAQGRGAADHGIVPCAAIICCTTRTAGSRSFTSQSFWLSKRRRERGRMNNQNMIETGHPHLRREPQKCMRCGSLGKLPGVGDEMEYHPHPLVSMVENGRTRSCFPRKGIHLPELLCSVSSAVPET